jgi:Site-specific recombinases, DNA invertase Pin homologs
MTKEENKKFAIYSRKSKFTGKGESVENQIEMCKQYIRLHNPNVSNEDIFEYEDEGYSGKTINRPKFRIMLDDARNNKFETIICYRFDRVSRSISDFSNLIQEFDKLKISFVSIKENFDTSSPIGRAMMYISSIFSQLERETIAERIRDNMRELAKSGRWLGGICPTGYKSKELVNKMTVDGKEKKAYKLEIIKEEAEMVKMIFSKFIETNSLTKTETYLRQNHIKTKNDRNFNRFSIRGILSNPVYMKADKEAWDYFNSYGMEIYSDQFAFDGKYGVMAFNKTIQTTGSSNQIRDMQDWIVAVGKHKALISGTDWVKVQKMLNMNKSKSYRKPKSNVALLSGLLFCAHCNDFMRPKQSQRLNANGEKIYNYLCETKEKTKMQDCRIKNPNGNELDRVVCDKIKELSEDSSDFLKGLEKGRTLLAVNSDEYDDKLNNLRKNHKDNEKKIKLLLESLTEADGTAASGHIINQINELHERNEMLKNQIEDFVSLTKDHAISDIEFDVMKEMLKNFSTTFDSMSVEEKRIALKTFIKRVVWDGENIHIFLFGDNDRGVSFAELLDEYGEPQCEGTK